jgi:hypothetical protein
MPPLLTAAEVAEILRVSRAQAYLLKDLIGYVRVGRAIRFEQDAVFAYVQGARRCHAPALVSTSAPTRPSGGRSGATTRATSDASPQVAETMARLLRGSGRAN